MRKTLTWLALAAAVAYLTYLACAKNKPSSPAPPPARTTSNKPTTKKAAPA